MNNKLRKLAATIAATGLISLSALNSSAALADSSDNTQQVTNGLSTAIGLATINNLSLMFRGLFDLGNAYNIWVQSLILSDATQAGIQSSHAVSAQSAALTTGYVFAATIAPLPPGSKPTIPFTPQGVPKIASPGFYASLVPVTRTAAGLDKSSYLSSGSLLSSTKFTNTSNNNEQAKAAVFIQFLQNAGNLLTPIDASSLSQADPGTVASYLDTLANFNAGQSVGLNALLNLYSERVPLSQLNGESPLSYDEKQVLKRMQPVWTASVTKMTIVDVARETLYTQAEMNYQMFQLRMQLEQLNATLAAMQLQQQQVSDFSTLQAQKAAVMQSIKSSANAQQQQQQ
ncbi:MAG: hypothetical protein HKM04_08270 [Legionellales bacterium]|nr:hypothetical protein [Legionellales bacterium]